MLSYKTSEHVEFCPCFKRGARLLFVTSLLLLFFFLVSPFFRFLSSCHCNLETENQGEKEGSLHILILEVGNPVMVLMSSGGGIGPGAHSRHGSLQASWSVGEIADTLVRGRVCVWLLRSPWPWWFSRARGEDGPIVMVTRAVALIDGFIFFRLPGYQGA